MTASLALIFEPRDAAPAAVDLRLLAANVQRHYDLGCADVARGMDHLISAGEGLAAAKKVLGHGKWLEWLRENTTIPERTARRYISLWKNQHLKSAIVADFASLLPLPKKDFLDADDPAPPAQLYLFEPQDMPPVREDAPMELPAEVLSSLDEPQRQVMTYLAANPKKRFTQPEIAHDLTMGFSVVFGVVAQLVTRGLLQDAGKKQCRATGRVLPAVRIVLATEMHHDFSCPRCRHRWSGDPLAGNHR